MCLRKKHLKVILLLGSVPIFVLTAACCGGDYWLDTYNGNLGLWRECSDVIGAFMRTCSNREAELGDHALKSERSLTILATVFSASASIIGFICNFTHLIKPVIASSCLIIASLASCIALSLFTYQNYGETTRELSSSSFGWSWYLGWIAVGLGFLLAPFGICCQPEVIREQRMDNNTRSKRYGFEREVKFSDLQTTNSTSNQQQQQQRVRYTTRNQLTTLPTTTTSYSNNVYIEDSSNEYV